MKCQDCHRVRSWLALVAGQDQGGTSAPLALDHHLENCVSCRQFQRDLTASQASLAEGRLLIDPRRRMWSRVSAALSERKSSAPAWQMPGWVPSTVAAAACLLMVSVAVFEVDRRGSRVLPALVGQGEASRDLFRTDPQFNSSYGRQPTLEDLRRWQAPDPFEGVPGLRQPELQQAVSPYFPRDMRNYRRPPAQLQSRPTWE